VYVREWLYLESKWEEIVELKKNRGLICMKKREICWKETHGIQILGIIDPQGNMKDGQRHILQILESYVTELYDRTYRPKNLEVETEEEVDRDEKYPYYLYSKVENAIKQRRDKNATGDYSVPEDVLLLLGEGGFHLLA